MVPKFVPRDLSPCVSETSKNHLKYTKNLQKNIKNDPQIVKNGASRLKMEPKSSPGASKTPFGEQLKYKQKKRAPGTLKMKPKVVRVIILIIFELILVEFCSPKASQIGTKTPKKRHRKTTWFLHRFFHDFRMVFEGFLEGF